MANLVCFPHYTCGALICDIMMNKMSPMGKNGAIQNAEHGRGKILDTDSVSVITPQEFQNKIDRLKSIDKFTGWIGTHAWPGNLDLAEFEKVLLITTTTSRSKIYRWSRVYRHYFLPAWANLTGQELIDKSRETAKNYTIPFEPVFSGNVINLEFADVVDHTTEFTTLIKDQQYEESIKRWHQVNNFLYTADFWNSDEVKFFYQAELEQNLQRYYIYN